MSESPPPRPHAFLSAAVVGTLVVVCVSAALVLNRLGAQADEIAALRARLGERPAAPPRADSEPGAPNRAAGEGSLDEKVDAVRADLDVLIHDVQRVERKLDGLTAQLEQRGQVQAEPPQPPELDWTQPALFETARKGAESVGCTLSPGELRCPARMVLREGPLEYLVVLKGGKEHETLFSIVGNVPEEARRPGDMGVKINNALQALGFRRGTPIRFGPSGTTPAQGETVRLYVEWSAGGATEVVRAEDLVWHAKRNRPMRPGSLVYVGSRFVPGDEPGSLDFAADLTAEVVATYSAPVTIVDNVDEDAQDDTVFLAATPRLPDGVDHVTLIFRRDELTEGVKEFPPPPTHAGDPAEEDGGR